MPFFFTAAALTCHSSQHSSYSIHVSKSAGLLTAKAKSSSATINVFNYACGFRVMTC